MAGNDLQYKVSAQGSTFNVAGPNHTTLAEKVPVSSMAHTENGVLQVSDPLTKRTLTLAYRTPSGQKPEELKAGRENLIRGGYQMHTIDTANGSKTVFTTPEDWRNYQSSLKDLKADHAKALKTAGEQLKKIDGVKSQSVGHPLFGRPSAKKPDEDKAKAAEKVMAAQLAAMKAVINAKPAPVAGKNPPPQPAQK